MYSQIGSLRHGSICRSFRNFHTIGPALLKTPLTIYKIWGFFWISLTFKLPTVFSIGNTSVAELSAFSSGYRRSCRDVLNTPDPQIYLGLVVGIWACLGLDLATFSVFYSILSLLMGKICLFWTFDDPNLGLTKWFNSPLRSWTTNVCKKGSIKQQCYKKVLWIMWHKGIIVSKSTGLR